MNSAKRQTLKSAGSGEVQFEPAVSLSDALSDFLIALDMGQSRKQGPLRNGIPTGFKDLDQLTGGLHPTDLIILTGKPGVGKTALALNIARNVALGHNRKVGFISSELSPLQLAGRLLIAEGVIDAKKMRSLELSKEDWHLIKKAEKRLSEAGIYLMELPGPDILDLQTGIRRLHIDYGAELVIIDDLYWILECCEEEPGAENPANIMGSLRNLARNLELILFGIVRISHEDDLRGNDSKRKNLSQFKLSKAIANNADLDLVLHRPTDKQDKREDIEEAELIVAQQQYGPTGKLWLSYFPGRLRFENVSTSM